MTVIAAYLFVKNKGWSEKHNNLFGTEKVAFFMAVLIDLSIVCRLFR